MLLLEPHPRSESQEDRVLCSTKENRMHTEDYKQLSAIPQKE